MKKFKLEMWVRARGGGSADVDNIKFYNIIFKSANVDKGGGGKTLIHKMWIKRQVFFKPLPKRTTRLQKYPISQK